MARLGVVEQLLPRSIGIQLDVSPCTVPTPALVHEPTHALVALAIDHVAVVEPHVARVAEAWDGQTSARERGWRREAYVQNQRGREHGRCDAEEVQGP